MTASASSDSSNAELAALEQAATTLNDSNAVSCTVPVFDGNEAVLFPRIQERKMTGIPGRPGNGCKPYLSAFSRDHLLSVLMNSATHKIFHFHYPRRTQYLYFSKKF